MPKISKFLMFVFFILGLIALFCAVLVSPLILLYFVARFYHLRKLAYIERDLIIKENEYNSNDIEQ